MAFCPVVSAAAGLRLLTPVLSRFRLVISIVYFAVMLAVQFWYSLLLFGHLFGDWL